MDPGQPPGSEPIDDGHDATLPPALISELYTLPCESTWCVSFACGGHMSVNTCL